MNIKTIVLLMMTFVIAACEDGADLDNVKSYKNADLSFNYPGNWDVTEDSIVDEVRFIFVESPGTGLMKMEVYNQKNAFELREFAELDIDALAGEMYAVIKISKPKSIIDLVKEVDGRVFKGLMYETNMSIVGIDVPHMTELFAFQAENKTAYLSGQVAIEDSHLVLSGFDLIVSSFKFNQP